MKKYVEQNWQKIIDNGQLLATKFWNHKVETCQVDEANMTERSDFSLYVLLQTEMMRNKAELYTLFIRTQQSLIMYRLGRLFVASTTMSYLWYFSSVGNRNKNKQKDMIDISYCILKDTVA